VLAFEPHAGPVPGSGYQHKRIPVEMASADRQFWRGPARVETAS